MKVVVTGAAGMIGRKLVESLLATPELTDRDGNVAEISSLVGMDVVEPDPPLPDHSRLTFHTGEISDEALMRGLIDGETDSVFHLAAVVSAQAEEDFDLGMRVNLGGVRAVLDACRTLDHAPRLVFASSVAAFGGDMPEVIGDATTPTPGTTYGMTKVVGEYVLSDYTRKGFVDGRALRLPTIVVRPGRPNKAASTWASSIIREPLAGHEAVCPVTPDSKMWMCSPRRIVAAFRHAHELGPEAWGTQSGAHRAINLPGITASVAETMEVLEAVGGPEVAARVLFEHDPFIQAIVDGWPNRFETPRADAMGFTADKDLAEIVQVFVEDDLPRQAAYYD